MVTIRGVSFRVVPPEEMIWAKLYVLQKDRCDWPDVMNLIEAQRQRLDWNHLLARLGSDAPLLRAVLSLFGWLCPGQRLPRSLQEQIDSAPPPEPGPESGRRRAELLDRRPWFQNLAGC